MVSANKLEDERKRALKMVEWRKNIVLSNVDSYAKEVVLLEKVEDRIRQTAFAEGRIS